MNSSPPCPPARRSPHSTASRQVACAGPHAALKEGHCLRDQALAICPPGRADAPDAYAATSLHTLVQMVAGGLGATLLPRLAIDAGIAAGTDIALRQLAGRGAWRTIGLAWRPDSPREADFRAFGRALGEVCGAGNKARGSALEPRWRAATVASAARRGSGNDDVVVGLPAAQR